MSMQKKTYRPGMKEMSLLALGACLLIGPSQAAATPPTPPTTPPPEASPPASANKAEQNAETSAEADADPTHATITFSTIPNVTAVVTWGHKVLGHIKPGKPLVIVRPHDSGPLDVVVRAKNYLPVQTRAHTFSDTRVAVKLTPPDKKSELLGYKAPIEVPVDAADEAAQNAAADAGIAAEATPPH